MEELLTMLAPGRERAVRSLLQRLRKRKPADSKNSASALILELGLPAKLARRLRQQHVRKPIMVANLMWQACVDHAEGWLEKEGRR